MNLPCFPMDEPSSKEPQTQPSPAACMPDLWEARVVSQVILDASRWGSFVKFKKERKRFSREFYANRRELEAAQVAIHVVKNYHDFQLLNCPVTQLPNPSAYSCPKGHQVSSQSLQALRS